MNVKSLIKELQKFSNFSSLKLNVQKSEVGWIGNGNKTDDTKAIRKLGIKVIYFFKEGIQILGLYFTYDKKFNIKYNFSVFIQTSLQL